MSGVGGVSVPPSAGERVPHQMTPEGRGGRQTVPREGTPEPESAASLQAPLPLPHGEQQRRPLPRREGGPCDYVTGRGSQTLSAAQEDRVWAPVEVVVLVAWVCGECLVLPWQLVLLRGDGRGQRWFFLCSWLGRTSCLYFLLSPTEMRCQWL